MADTIVDHAAISENDIRSLDQLSDNEVKKLKKNMKLTHHNISSHFLHLQSKVIVAGNCWPADCSFIEFSSRGWNYL